MSKFYDDLCNWFVRPMRQTYSPHDLGPPLLPSGVVRKDFVVVSRQNLKLKCSYYLLPSARQDVAVVYLHSFNGSRLQSLRYIQSLVQQGIQFCSFDFAGSGNSEGQYVSLGSNQKFDALDVLKHIQREFEVEKFCLWGRSMGAVTAVKLNHLFRQSRRHSFQIKAIVLDSPFVSLNKLVTEMAEAKSNVFSMLASAIFNLIKPRIEQLGRFKIEDLQLESDVGSIGCPTLILASKEDNLINWQHSMKIYRAIRHTNKELRYIKGEHNDRRDPDTVRNILSFLFQHAHPSPLKQCEQKESRSLRRYQTKKKTQLSNVPNSFCFESPRPDRGSRSIQKLQIHSLSYQTKLLQDRKVEGNNQLKQKMKPVFSSQVAIQCISQGESHFNIISNKLKKRAKVMVLKPMSTSSIKSTDVSLFKKPQQSKWLVQSTNKISLGSLKHLDYSPNHKYRQTNLIAANKIANSSHSTQPIKNFFEIQCFPTE